MGVAADYPPFAFIENNVEKGFSIDLAHLLAKELGFDLVIMNMNFHDLIPTLKNGGVDFILSSLTPTTDRAKDIGFSTSYFSQNFAVLMLANANATKVLNFSNQTIGVVKGTVLESLIAEKQEINPSIGLLSLDTVGELVTKLKENKLNGIILAKEVALNIEKSNKPLFKVAVMEGKTQEYAIAFRKGSLWKDKFDDILNSEKIKAKVNTLKKKWFGDNPIGLDSN